MYLFNDRGKRDLCLIPEVTAVIQRLWNESLVKTAKRPCKLFYIQRCYRYERPQAGRYREFTQAGIEILGGNSPEDQQEAVELLKQCLDLFSIDYAFNSSIKRGLSYYTENGFEASVLKLGAQKQVAGGGRYKEGIGWAIGIDRLALALLKDETNG